MSRDLVENILIQDYVKSNDLFEEAIVNLLEQKLLEMKKSCAAKLSANVDEGLLKIGKTKLKIASPSQRANQSLEEEPIEEQRINIVKVRIRGGKIQRRKKVSNVPGMTMRGSKLVRMSPSERRRRKLGAKKAARKSKAKRSQSLRKRKLSLMKRKRLGG
jgi:hypothetical protein